MPTPEANQANPDSRRTPPKVLEEQRVRTPVEIPASIILARNLLRRGLKAAVDATVADAKAGQKDGKSPQ